MAPLFYHYSFWQRTSRHRGAHAPSGSAHPSTRPLAPRSAELRGFNFLWQLCVSYDRQVSTQFLLCAESVLTERDSHWLYASQGTVLRISLLARALCLCAGALWLATMTHHYNRFFIRRQKCADSRRSHTCAVLDHAAYVGCCRQQ